MNKTKKKVELPKEENQTKEDVKEIKVIERVIENKELAPQDVFGKLTRSQVNLMKRTVAKGASDDELKLFLQVCRGANLNPFLKQVFLVPRWDSKEGREIRAIQVSIDGLRSIAEESGQYAGNEDPVFADEEEIKYKDRKDKEYSFVAPKKATVTVKKLIGGRLCDFTATARWDEYYPSQKLGFQWHQRPYLMLGKCAEALALRKAFPKLMSGMYAQEEMDKTIEGESEEVKTVKAFDKLLKVIKNSSIEELQEYQEKMEKSDKYTTAQKKKFNQVIIKRLTEIENE